MSWFHGIIGTLAFVLLQPQQILKQEVLSVDQHRITGANATAVTQHSRWSLIIVSDRSQIPVDQPEPSPQNWGDSTTNRPTEYNTLDDKYARVITEELMPVLYKDYNISRDPEMHGIGGSSSGAIAAFTVAWERPNDFRKVLSNVGSFVNLRGGDVYPERVLASEKKPIRIFLCDGRNDNRGTRPENPVYDQRRDWFYQNVRLMKALTQKGYDVNYAWGINLHGQKYGGAIMPDMMRWLWRSAGEHAKG